MTGPEPRTGAGGDSVCRLCGADAAWVFRADLLAEQIDYFECAACRYVQTQQPDWLERAYAEPINRFDVGLVLRNQQNVARVFMLLLAIGELDGRVLDSAGGYGLLVRMLRDLGVDARWMDAYTQNLMARGFEWNDDGEPALATAFEVLEHLVDPVAEFDGLARGAPVVLTSTQLAPDDSADLIEWSYRAPEHGQHIGFYRAETVRVMGERLGYSTYLIGTGYQIFARRPLPRHWWLLQKLWRAAPMLAGALLESRLEGDVRSLRGR